MTLLVFTEPKLKESVKTNGDEKAMDNNILKMKWKIMIELDEGRKDIQKIGFDLTH